MEVAASLCSPGHQGPHDSPPRRHNHIPNHRPNKSRRVRQRTFSAKSLRPTRTPSKMGFSPSFTRALCFGRSRSTALFARMVRPLRRLLLLRPRLSPARPLCRSNLIASGSAHCTHGRWYCPPCLGPSRLLRKRNFPARRGGERTFQSPGSYTITIPPDEVPNYLNNLIQPISLLLQFLQHPGEIRHRIPPHVVWSNCAVHTTR
jgi:hypothetical protein